MGDSPEERQHWREVLRAFDGYMQYHLSANHARRMAFLGLPRDARKMFEKVGYRDKLDAVDEGIRQNAEFIDLMIQDPVFADMLTEPDHAHSAHEHGHSHDHGSHSNGHEQAHSHGHEHATEDPFHDTPTAAHSHSHSLTPPLPSGPSPAPRDQRAKDLAQDKVRSTLRSFVRDWSVAGASERAACYDPFIEALEKHFPDPSVRGAVKVLVPGCGLGRLAMEIAARGFWAQGNEFSTYMLIASHFALNQSTLPEEHTVYPWLHSFSNHQTTGSHLLRSVRVPDVVPADIFANSATPPGGFSLVAGDFEEIYGPAHWGPLPAHPAQPGGDDEDEDEAGDVNQRGRWGAVATCFFIDTARNVLNYLRIIHGLLEDGGVWINLGPLLWHFENAPTKSARGEGSIELSLDEVKDLARKVGFDITDERMVSSTYTGIPDSMLQHVYNCSFWTATKIPGSGSDNWTP